MVASPSRLRRSEPDAADVRASPSIRNSGPRIPPNATIAIIQGASARRNGASEFRTPSTKRVAWPIMRPPPAPKYRRPATSWGLLVSTSSFANGVEAPNRRADASASGTPGQSALRAETLWDMGGLYHGAGRKNRGAIWLAG